MKYWRLIVYLGLFLGSVGCIGVVEEVALPAEIVLPEGATALFLAT